ncbi:MAG: sulfotransferase domain-containing protein [Oscillatoria sp. SIO1A7]|nr:sulfotransferase domain-containing protein [Oscillatoria sp. SIO1A7]
MRTKHIAMWACPRTRSTAITRAFEQIDDCMVYDEPFIHLSFIDKINYHNIIKMSKHLPNADKSYANIVKKLIGDLPAGKSFSFQKHMSFHLLPGFDKSWLSKVKNCFLIRNPRETVVSYWKARKYAGFSWENSEHFVGWEEHYRLFKEIEDLTAEKPIVIDSEELVKDPRGYFKKICCQLGIDFSEKMLSWTPEETNVLSWKNSIFEAFRKDVINSSGFFHESKKIHIPDILVPCINKCMPLYEEMYKHRLQ